MNCNQIKSITKKYLIDLLYLVFFFILLILFDFHQLVTDSNLMINIDPKAALSVFTHSWDSTFGFGQSTNWSAAYIFPNLLSRYALFELLGQRLGQSVYFSLIFLIGARGMHFLIENIFYVDSSNNSRKLMTFAENINLFLSSLFYVCNVYFFLVFVGASTMTYSHVALPFQIGILLKAIRVRKITLSQYFFFAFATLLMSGTSPPYIVISALVLLFVVIHQLYLKDKSYGTKIASSNIVLKLVLLAFVTFLVNAIWILPITAHFTNVNKTDVVAAMVESPEMHNKQTSYLNVFRNMGLWSFGGSYNGKTYYAFSDLYLNENYLQMFFFSGAIFFILFLIFNKRRRNVLFLFLFILFIPLAVGTNQGLFSGVYRWLYDNIPGFLIFRGSYKFVGILVLCQSISMAGLVYILRKNRLLVMLIFPLYVSVVVINGLPLFSKGLFESGKLINEIPKYYKDAGDFFSEDKSSYRIWLLPDQYLGFYEWGKLGANVEVVWQKPLVVRLATSSQHPMNVAVDELMNNLKMNNLNKIYYLARKHNIKYVVVREDAVWDHYPDLAVSIDQINSLFQSFPVKRIGALRIYTIPGFVDNRINGSNVVGFSQISPSLYRVELNCVQEANIIFSEKKDYGWNFYKAESLEEEYNSWLKQQEKYLSLFLSNKLLAIRNDNTSSEINEWNVDTRAVVCRDGEKHIYMYYTAQTAITSGIMLTILSCFFGSIYLVIAGSRNEGIFECNM